ncbi:hypothetical protein, partial [Escherichia coli]|uniref:hypothetical protein n=1 Tax=Escherichia coli TaxID=562 RepID=UPI0019512300
RRNDASMTGQVMIYGGKFYFKWMFHKLHLQMSDYVQHLGCSSVHATSGIFPNGDREKSPPAR